jgi:hypothetical protein
MRTLLSRRELRPVELGPARASSRSLFLRLQTMAGSRCVKSVKGIVAVALTGTEIRLLCCRHWRIYRRTQYRIAPQMRKANQGHIPISTGWIFTPVFVSDDRRVRIGWEVAGRTRRCVVQLFPRRGSRIRPRPTGCIWYPTISEVRALADFYGKPIPPVAAPQAIREELDLMKGRLREMFCRLHPNMTPQPLGSPQNSTNIPPSEDLITGQ